MMQAHTRLTHENIQQERERESVRDRERERERERGTKYKITNPTE